MCVCESVRECVCVLLLVYLTTCVLERERASLLRQADHVKRICESLSLLSLSDRPESEEMTALGAAIAAGLAQGVWPDPAHLPTLNYTRFNPSISADR